MTSAPCPRASDLLARASAILSDNSVGADRTWPQGELLQHLNEALMELHKLRPDIFTQVVAMELRPGAAQVVPPGYSSFVGLLSNITVDETGFETASAPIVESDGHFAAALERKPCLSAPRGSAAAAPYTIASYSRDAEVSTSFVVSPPVPVGQAPQVRAKLVAWPPVFSPSTLGECLGVAAAYQASLLDWVLMRSYAKETDSQYAVAQVERYRKAWYDALNVAYLQDSRWNSGLWAGVDRKRPEADPNFRQH